MHRHSCDYSACNFKGTALRQAISIHNVILHSVVNNLSCMHNAIPGNGGIDSGTGSADQVAAGPIVSLTYQ